MANPGPGHLALNGPIWVPPKLEDSYRKEVGLQASWCLNEATASSPHFTVAAQTTSTQASSLSAYLIVLEGKWHQTTPVPPRQEATKSEIMPLKSHHTPRTPQHVSAESHRLPVPVMMVSTMHQSMGATSANSTNCGSNTLKEIPEHSKQQNADLLGSKCCAESFEGITGVIIYNPAMIYSIWGDCVDYT